MNHRDAVEEGRWSARRTTEGREGALGAGRVCVGELSVREQRGHGVLRGKHLGDGTFL